MTSTHLYKGLTYQVINHGKYTQYLDREVYYTTEPAEVKGQNRIDGGWTVDRVAKYCLDNGYSGFVDRTNCDDCYHIKPARLTRKMLLNKMSKIGKRTGHYGLGNCYQQKVIFYIVNPDYKPINRVIEKEEPLEDIKARLHIQLEALSGLVKGIKDRYPEKYVPNYADCIITDSDEEKEEYESEYYEIESGEELETIYI